MPLEKYSLFHSNLKISNFRSIRIVVVLTTEVTHEMNRCLVTLRRFSARAVILKMRYYGDRPNVGLP